MLDVTRTLKDTENALRDLTSEILREKLGEDWVEKCGVSADRIAKWRERKDEEQKHHEAGTAEERLLYYADFHDLRTILHKNWGDFAPILGDWKTMDVYLDELEKMRNPEAHRRELFPYQKNLVLGVAGEIRSRIVKYRSKEETGADYYPRIESVRDSLGNSYLPGRLGSLMVLTKMSLRPGDTIDFVVAASDPMGAELEYRFQVGRLLQERTTGWLRDNTHTVEVERRDVGDTFGVQVEIRSPREYRALGDYDDFVQFRYSVLPPKGVAGKDRR
jgi:hypothetical protein